MQSTAILSKEHRVIEQGLAMLEEVAFHLAKNDDVPVTTVAALLDFFERYIGQCHCAKSEGIVFAALAEHGLTKDRKPMSEICQQHARERALLSKMQRRMARIEIDAAAREQFVAVACEYITLMRRHIGIADTKLFPLADVLLSADDDREVTEAMKKYEAENFTGEKRERLQNLIESLQHEFPVAAPHIRQ